MLTDEQLAEIEARANAATPPPWTPHDEYPHVAWQRDDAANHIVTTSLSERPAEDIRFIAAARTDVPALLAEVKQLRADLEAESTRADTWRAAYEGTLDGIAQQLRNAQEEFSAILIDEYTGGDDE